MKKFLILLITVTLSFTFNFPAQAALGDVTIAVVDSDGNPMPYGDLYWETPNKQFHSIGSFYSDNKGQALVKNMYLGEVVVTGFWIDRNEMLVIEGTWTIEVSSRNLTLQIPKRYEINEHKVFVSMPNGEPVANSRVTLSFIGDSHSDLRSFGRVWDEHQFGTISFSSMCANADDGNDYCKGSYFAGSSSVGDNLEKVNYVAITDSNGVATFKGFSEAFAIPGIDVEVFASFADDATYQQTDPVDFDPESTNKLTLDYMPWFEIEDQTINTIYGTLVPVEVQLREQDLQLLASRDFSGYEAKITPPVGAKSKKCKGKSKLSSTTNASGIAKFKVCAAKSGEYKISAPGVVSNVSINMKVKGAAPGLPAVASYETPAKKTIELMVKAPFFTGGAKVVKYKIVVSGSEKGGAKQFSKTFNVAFKKPSQQIRLIGINSYGPTSVKVSAVTKNGTGDFVEVFPTLW